MISSLITSQTRIKLLRKFFLNSSTRAHLRGLESEFGDSSNAIRLELNRFEKAGLLNATKDGNKKFYQANTGHPLFRDIHNIIIKETGLDRLVDKIVNRIGNLECVYLTGDFACGKDSPVIELLLVGCNIDREYLARKVVQAEEITGRKVSFVVLQPDEAGDHLGRINPNRLLPLWNCPCNDGREVPHTPAAYRGDDVVAPVQTTAGAGTDGSAEADRVRRWYAVYTRPRAEKKVLMNLTENGCEAWLPLYKTLRQWSDRRKMIEKPLISSYVFVKVTERDFYKVQGTEGVCRLVKNQGRPVPIPQVQIDNLRLIINSNAKVELSGEKFDRGDAVVVTTGSLKGLKGELISQGNRKKLLVRIDSIDHNITVTVPVSYLRKL